MVALFRSPRLSMRLSADCVKSLIFSSGVIKPLATRLLRRHKSHFFTTVLWQIPSQESEPPLLSQLGCFQHVFIHTFAQCPLRLCRSHIYKALGRNRTSGGFRKGPGARAHASAVGQTRSGHQPPELPVAPPQSRAVWCVGAFKSPRFLHAEALMWLRP